MITALTGYRDDKGRLEVEVKMDGVTSLSSEGSGEVLRTFVVEESDMYPGTLTFTSLPPEEKPSWGERN